MAVPQLADKCSKYQLKEGRDTTMKVHQLKVRKSFIAAFDLQDDFVEEDLVYNEYRGWDSVGHMGLVASLEEVFDCMLEMDEILDISSFAKAVEIMEKHA